MSKFEFNLLRILRFMVGHFPADQGMQLVRDRDRPPRVPERGSGRAGARTRSRKACVLFLVRAGRLAERQVPARQRHRPPGRVWERIPLDERTLEFSPPVLEFLIWATAEKVHETKIAVGRGPESA